jgi:hypothetical protein
MDKEREGIFESGYSEEELDKQANKLTDQNQVKPARNASASVAGGAVNIFDPKKKSEKEKIILDSQNQ